MVSFWLTGMFQLQAGITKLQWSILDAGLIHQWLSQDAYWALGRSREKQDSAIAGSLNFGVYDCASGQQLGYARVVTDRATFAWLCDVYIAPAVRAAIG